jgi:hypothetical protein
VSRASRMAVRVVERRIGDLLLTVWR